MARTDLQRLKNDKGFLWASDYWSRNVYQQARNEIATDSPYGSKGDENWQIIALAEGWASYREETFIQIGRFRYLIVTTSKLNFLSLYPKLLITMKHYLVTTFFIFSLMASCQTTQNTNENQTLKTIHSRKSVRLYSERSVTKEQLLELVKAGMAAPSGMDIRPWEFIILTERLVMDTLAQKLPYAKMLTQVNAAIVVCGNNDKQNGGSSYWYLDCSAATQNILLAAESMGLGAVWTAAYPYEERMNPIKNILKLPENIQPLCVIPIGYPKQEGSPKNKFNAKKIHYNEFSK